MTLQRRKRWPPWAAGYARLCPACGRLCDRYAGVGVEIEFPRLCVDDPSDPAIPRLCRLELCTHCGRDLRETGKLTFTLGNAHVSLVIKPHLQRATARGDHITPCLGERRCAHQT